MYRHIPNNHTRDEAALRGIHWRPVLLHGRSGGSLCLLVLLVFLTSVLTLIQMNAFSEGTFTLVIDKGTIDSLFCKVASRDHAYGHALTRTLLLVSSYLFTRRRTTTYRACARPSSLFIECSAPARAPSCTYPTALPSCACPTCAVRGGPWPPVRCLRGKTSSCTRLSGRTTRSCSTAR